MKITRTSPKRSERPARILAAASLLMARYGYDKTTMDDIAREAGVSKGALYLSWSSKEGLFDALLRYEMQRLLLELRQRIDADPEGNSLVALYTHTLLAMQNNPLICALYLRDGKILGDFIHRQDPERYNRRLMLSAESIRQFQAAGLIRDDIQANVVAHLFSILALGFLSISSVISPEMAPPLPDTVNGLSAMVNSGLSGSNQNQNLPKEAIFKMIDLMQAQNDMKGKND